MSPKPIKKLYYSISEVAEMTNLKQYVLRYWETEFDELKPSKNRAGNRVYKEKEIQLINTIKDLLYTKKFTIEGARKYLKQNGGPAQPAAEEDTGKDDKLNMIEKIRSDLEDILNILNDK